MTECKWLGSTELQACSHSFALSGSPMQTQPQAKRTTTGEALHLPLAPLQNSGYGLKRILQQKHLVHRLLLRPSICAACRAAYPGAGISSKGALLR